MIRPLLPCLLLAPLCAQVPRVSMAAHTDVGMYVKHVGGDQLRFLRRGTSMNRLNIASNGTGFNLVTSIDSNRGLTASILEQGRAYNTTASPSTEVGTTRSTDVFNITNEPHDVMVRYQGTMRGYLQIYYSGRADTGSSASIAIDIGADGSTEFRRTADGGQHSYRQLVAVAGDLFIKVTMQAKAITLGTPPSSSAFSSSVAIVLEPLPGTVAGYGAGCGPVAAGRLTTSGLQHRLEVVTTGAIPNAPVVHVIGLQAASFPWPSPSCPLLVVPILTATSLADGAGRAVFAANADGYHDGSIFIQAIPFDAATATVLTTNGVEFRFAP